ncbi:MAG: hypothetical protein GX931_06925 [Acholeplasmataceae bacterium]|nr:hypothetical protein [Acholeplasmataceae bacterium]
MMRCYICGKVYYYKRNLKTLFTYKISYRCLSCEKKYKLSINYQVIPKEKGVFHIISLFNERNNFNLLAFNEEIAYIIKHILKEMNKKNDTFLWLDVVNEEIFNYLDKIKGDIYLLTNYTYI